MNHEQLPIRNTSHERVLGRDITIPTKDHEELRALIITKTPELFKNAPEIERVVRVIEAPFETAGIDPEVAYKIGRNRTELTVELDYYAKGGETDNDTIACQIALTNDRGDITTIALDEHDFVIDFPSDLGVKQTVDAQSQNEKHHLSTDQVISLLYSGLGLKSFEVEPYGVYPQETPVQAIARIINYYRDGAKRTTISDTVGNFSASTDSNLNVQGYGFVGITNKTTYVKDKPITRDIELKTDVSITVENAPPITRMLSYQFRPGTEVYRANRDNSSSAYFSIRQGDVDPSDQLAKEYFDWISTEELTGVIEDNGRFRELAEKAFNSLAKQVLSA